jgi:hypothetical protein
MIWVAYFMLALESLVLALSLWMMWVMISEASRTPADPSFVVEHPPERRLAQPPEYRPEPKHKDVPALFALEEADERGYVSSRKLHMGCEAAVCPTPFGARIVAGRHSLQEPQYAWDYASVRLAEVNRKRGGYLDLAAEGIMSRDELRAKLAALDISRAAAERELAAVRDQAARLDEFEREAETVLEAYTQVTPEALDALAPEQRQQFYRVLGLRVTAHQDAPPEIDGTFVVDGALKAVEQPFRSSDTA